MAAVRTVIAEPRASLLPTAPEPVLGLLNVRGEIMPMLDIAALLGTGRTELKLFAAVVEVAAGFAALATSGPPLARPLGPQLSRSDHPAAGSVHDQDGRLATLLDLEALLNMRA